MIRKEEWGEAKFCFSPIFMNVDILLIGCGGTGGSFFSKMARFLAGLNTENMNISFRIMDGDYVEAKNLGRQPFVEEDIGRNKAVALANAAEEALDLKVKAYPQYLSPKTSGVLHQQVFSSSSSSDLKVVIGAVDNHVCRKMLHEYFIQYKGWQCLFYIDAANELSSGEIVIGKRDHNDIEAPDRCHYYPEILTDEGKAPYEMSCEELNQVAPQHLATNSIAADLLFSFVVQLLAAGEYACKAPGGIVYFDAFKMFSRFDVYQEERHGKIVKK